MTEDEALNLRSYLKYWTCTRKGWKSHFDARKNLLEYDDVLNQQRIVIYGYRREVLEAQKIL